MLMQYFPLLFGKRNTTTTDTKTLTQEVLFLWNVTLY